MLSHSLREELNMEIESEDRIGRSSEFQSEQVWSLGVSLSNTKADSKGFFEGHENVLRYSY